jgi:BirA family biotin operon repressor/biotin-[acetyl-CoA-carboxylase] ligase
LSHPAITRKYHPIGHPFVELESVDSTNNYAMALIHAGLTSQGTVYFAHEQTRGKGQRGKTWFSTKGENILLSAVLEPVFLQPTEQFTLSMAIALAAYDFLSQQTQGEWSIKWPNDLYWRDRKAGGILIESVCRGREWLFAVAGIGININQTHFPKKAIHAVSLKQITGSEFSAVALARDLCQHIDTRYRALAKKPVGELLNEYNEHLFRRGQSVQLKKNDESFTAIIHGVSATGQLLILSDSGNGNHKEESYDFGEVEWLLVQ